MSKLLVIILFFCSFQQDENWKLLERINKKSDYIAIDQLSNVYLLNNKVLTKYSKEGKYLAEYSNNFLGTISSIDISEPLRILVFYEEYNQLVFLDNKLSEISSPINLDDLETGLVKLSCSAEEGGFWVYSSQLQQLLHFSKELNIKNRSNQLNSLISNNEEPNFLMQKNNRLFLNVPQTGILVFNHYGFYQKTIPIHGLESFQVVNQQIYYSFNDSLFIYDERRIDYDTLIFNNPFILDIKIEQSTSIIRTKDFVEIYKKSK